MPSFNEPEVRSGGFTWRLFILWGNMILKIKNKNKIKKLIVFFINFFLINPLMKLIKKEKNKEKFLIREKTF